MSVVAHIGPPMGSSGGPAGYLKQLAAAFDGHGAGSTVLFPPPIAPQAPSARAQAVSPLAHAMHRVRRAILGAPRFFRPDMSAVRARGGALQTMFDGALAESAAENAGSLTTARAGHADVLYTHSLAGAEAALAARSGRQVWMMLHAPMPTGLYLAWSWGVPEIDWREILAFPDVRALIDRELDVCARVDRVIIPCPEAFDELVRCDSRFETVRSRVSYVVTGASRRGSTAGMTRSQARARFGLPLDQPVGLYLGNLEPYRGVDHLVAGLERLVDERSMPGCIAIAGPDPRTVPAGRRIRALGRVDDVDALFRAVDFIVNVNRFSLFDLAIIEALEAGKPLLMHATGGNRAFQRLGAGCEMLANLETETVAAGLERMFSMPEATLIGLGGRSRASYESHFTLAAFRLGHEHLYDSVLAGAVR
jgi:glycosyltransferase involved in cell wall biosynthesis